MCSAISTKPTASAPSTPGNTPSPTAPRNISSKASATKNPPPPAALPNLTPREREVLLRVGAGRTEKEVATELGRSASTIHHQLTSAYAKLHVHNRAEALNVLRGAGGASW